jgi:hypothetical protein
VRDRTGQILRLACLILATLVVAQLIRTSFHVSRFFGVHIPHVPTLQTNAVSAPVSVATTPASAADAPATNVQTNASPGGQMAKVSTQSTTNLSTNLVALKPAGTNPVSTNVVARTGTNDNGTNHNLSANTNAGPKMAHRPSPPMMMPPGMGFGGMPGMPGMMGGQVALPPEIQARVDKIVNSEVFAPVMHPMPMGLLGIAGDTAFIRTDSGQTGLVKEGDSLGGVKLLTIGINRVLVEQGGQKKELTIFDGYGSDSLLSQSDKSSK